LSEIPTCALVIAETLRGAGVRRVFGHPGGEVLDFMQALERCGIDFVLAGHESAAAFMAGAMGRITGFPGVCLATLGPGACNLVLGVGCALLDRDPLLAFSARATGNRAGTNPKQHLRLNDLFVPVSKWSVGLTGARTAATVGSALSVAQAPPRGPVYLTLPSDVAVAREHSDGPLPTPPTPPPDHSGHLEAIGRALNAARRPVGVIGISLDPGTTRDAVRSFFAETGMPYVTSPQAKGLADESAGTFLGTVGAGAGENPILDFLNRSDCLLGIGFDPVEFSQEWYLDRPLCSLAAWPAGFGSYQPMVECVGDVAGLLNELRGEYRGTPAWTAAEIEAVRRSVQAAISPASVGGRMGFAPYHLIRTLRQALPEETVMVADVGAHKMLLAQVWRAPEPASLLISNGLSAMGYGVPTVLAAALLRPERPVVGVVGDGGFGMMVQELETAKRLRLNPLFVVLCDRSLAVIKMAQNARGLPHLGVDFAPVNWAKVGEGFGARACAPCSFAEVEKEIQDWVKHRELTLLAISIDETLYAGITY
jgi:acetolactate synthase I/II/III large subunit